MSFILVFKALCWITPLVSGVVLEQSASKCTNFEECWKEYNKD